MTMTSRHNTKEQTNSPSTTQDSSADELSDDEEGAYNNIMQSASGSEVRLLFSKSKVYVHPSPSSKDNIAGFIALIQRQISSVDTASSLSADPSYLLAWLPETSLGSDRDLYSSVELADSNSISGLAHKVHLPATTSQHHAAIGSYAFAVPLNDIYSLLIRPPNLGWWFGSLVINTRAGYTLPALFFHDDECQSTILQRKQKTKDTFDPFGEHGTTFWGGDEILRWIRKFVVAEKSGADPSIYLINPSSEDRLGFGQGPERVSANGSTIKAGTGPFIHSSNDAGMDNITKALKQARWSFLEKMSQVTNFTRRTALDIVDSPRLPPQVKRIMMNPEVQTLQEEFDSARVYLAKWATGIAEQGEKDRRRRMTAAADVLALDENASGEAEMLDLEVERMTLEGNRAPVTQEEWSTFFDEAGYLKITVDEVKRRIFHGGLDPSDGVRKEAWLFLLGVYDWHSSASERKSLLSKRRDEYVRLKRAWWDRTLESSASAEERESWREEKFRIEKDVHRTDRHIPLFEGEDTAHPDPDSPFADTGTNVHLEQMKDLLITYNEYNKELGYVQGMSDLLAPIYAVEQDDAVAFWGFVEFMKRMEKNFLRDQSGMRMQLLTLDHLVQLLDPALYSHLQSADSTNFFFTFRMLLVCFKRELPWSDILRLWESLWTDLYSRDFHLFFALAILEKHRDVIMTHLKRFDEVLKFVNDLCNDKIDLESTLVRAEALFLRFQRTIEAVDKEQNFPGPRVQMATADKPSQNGDDSVASTERRSRESKRARNAIEEQSSVTGLEAKQKHRIISPELRALLRRTASDASMGL